MHKKPRNPTKTRAYQTGPKSCKTDSDRPEKMGKKMNLKMQEVPRSSASVLGKPPGGVKIAKFRNQKKCNTKKRKTKDTK